jgi:hypothetical protein
VILLSAPGLRFGSSLILLLGIIDEKRVLGMTQETIRYDQIVSTRLIGFRFDGYLHPYSYESVQEKERARL